MTTPKSLDELLQDAVNESFVTRLVAASLLKQFHDPRAVTMLIKLLYDTDEVVCTEAAISLKDLKDVRAVPALFKRFLDPATPDSVKLVSGGVLRSFGSVVIADLLVMLPTVSETNFTNVLKIFKDLADPTTIQALNEIREQISDPARQQAIEDTIQSITIQDSDPFGYWVQQLNSPDERVRNTAAVHLYRLNDERAIVPLIECFIDPKRREKPDSDGDVSHTIPYAIKHFGAKAIPHLTPYLKDPLDAWHKSLLWLFIYMAEPSSIPALTEAYRACKGEGVERHTIDLALKAARAAEAKAHLNSVENEDPKIP